MAMYYSMSSTSNEGIAFIRKLLKAMPSVIREALNNPKVGPKGMLVNMRQTLNEINSSNDNIKSYAITSFGIEVARSLPYKRKISGATWIDFSRETLSLYIPEKDIMIKFSYHLISKVHFASASSTMQVRGIKQIWVVDNKIEEPHISYLDWPGKHARKYGKFDSER